MGTTRDGEPVKRPDIAAGGLTFEPQGPFRYGVHRRLMGNTRTPHVTWQGFASVNMPDTARHVFAMAVRRYDAGEVFLLDYDAGRIMAKGRYGRVLFDHMTPTKG